MANLRATRALVVCAYFPFPVISGGRKRAVRLMESMSRAGATPYILSLDENNTGLAEARDRGWGAEVLPPPRYSPSTRLRQHLRGEPVGMSVALGQRIRQLGAESAFIQLEEIEAAQYVGVASRVAPTAVSLHNVDSAARGAGRYTERGVTRARAEYHNWRLRNVEARAARRGGAIICVSANDSAYFVREGSSRVILAPNGVDSGLLSISSAVSTNKDVLFFGQLGWAPNAEGLMQFLRDGWPRVRSRIPSARLRVAGPDPDWILKGRSHADDGVEVLGFVDEIGAELATARAVVAPIWSGGGTRIKVLEAMAAARPVVGTPLAVEEIGFEDGVHGLVGDTPSKLADHVVKLLENPSFAEACGIAARDRARQFEWSLSTAAAESLYAEWVELHIANAGRVTARVGSLAGSDTDG